MRPELAEFEVAPYRLLSDADLERLANRPSLVVVDRMIALLELERRKAATVSRLAARAERN